MTDSKQVERSKDEKNPLLGEECEPETMCLQAVGAHGLLAMRDGVPFA